MSQLSRQDLAELAASPSDEKKIGIAEHVVEAVKHGRLSEEEFAIADQVLAIMAKDAADRVRQSLSEIVSSVPEIPKHIVDALARDFDEIAAPVLKNSPLFSEDELIEIIRQGSIAKQTAVAQRDVVPERVAAVIVEETGEEPVAALMGNPGAEVTPKLMDRVIERFEHSEMVTSQLVRRENLPVTVAERLVSIVSERLRGFLMARPEISNNLANTVATQSREKATISLFDIYGRGRNIGLVVAQLKQAGKLTPSLILRAACTGDMGFLEAALGALSGLPPANIWKLIHDGGEKGLEKLLEQCKLSTSIAPMLQVAIDTFHELDFDGREDDINRFRMSMIQRVLTKVADGNADDIDYLLLKVDQLIKDTPYQEAV